MATVVRQCQGLEVPKGICTVALCGPSYFKSKKSGLPTCSRIIVKCGLNIFRTLCKTNKIHWRCAIRVSWGVGRGQSREPTSPASPASPVSPGPAPTTNTPRCPWRKVNTPGCTRGFPTGPLPAPPKPLGHQRLDRHPHLLKASRLLLSSQTGPGREEERRKQTVHGV